MIFFKFNDILNLMTLKWKETKYIAYGCVRDLGNDMIHAMTRLTQFEKFQILESLDRLKK
jgi:hypothetical protein